MFAQLEFGDWRNWIEKAEALDYLSRYDVPNAGPAVQKVLDNKHPNNRWLRGQAVIAMARIDPDKAPALATAHVEDPHTEVRVAVARVCVDLTKDQAAPILKVLFEDKTPAVQFATLAAYARHHREQAWDRAESLTAEIPEDALESAIRALAWIGNEPALERLRERIDSGKHPRVIFDGLAGVTNPSLVPIYLGLLASSDDLTLLSGVWAQLKTFERNAVVSACQAALASGDPKMLQAVSRLVASHLREPALGEPLQTALNLSEDRVTRLLGLSALSCTEADRYADFFVSNLEHEDPPVRAMAVHCLAQCQEVNLYEVLEKTLSDEDAVVRVAALTALRHTSGDSVPEERILDYFTSSLLSPDHASRVAAVEALVPYVNLDNAQAAL
ncbi:MAG: HEAT repeat domain-containing protein, partial [Halioglobus sp.]